VKVGGQEINGKIIARIQEMIDLQPDLSRVKLSRQICEQLKWQSPNGRLKEVSCRVALLKLQRRGAIRLPEGARFPAGPRRIEKVAEVETEPGVDEPLKAFQPLELVRIESAETPESGLWNDLMDRYHYLGAGPLCGCQIRYLIHSQKQGWLGGLAFSAAAWRVAARDAWIGWDRETREQHLNQVVANSRFLILPQRRVRHLASHVLGLALRRLRSDWRQRYGYEPWLVETFIEADRFAGTCYRAANFVEVGKTQGRGRQDGQNQRRLAIKRVLLYGWSRQARQQLCRVETRGRRPAPVAKDWAEGEFGRTRLPDERLRKRLLTMARDLYARPQAQIPEACQSRAKTKAAYRFFDHAETGMEILLEPHYQATRQRLTKEKIVLAVQDSTSLNYTAHPATDDLGPLGTRVDGAMGLWLHNTMAFSLEGTPLGLLDVQCWARDGREFGKHHQRKQRPIEQKESYKWLKSFQQVAAAQRCSPETLLVSVGDREADIYELFELAGKDPRSPKLLVRAEYDRLLADDQEHLWPMVASQPMAATQDLQVPRRGNQPARVAHLGIRFAAVRLKPPQRKAHLPCLDLWAVLAEDVEAPPGVKTLRWMLLTTCEVTSAADAIEKIDWYRLRWGIEVYHRTLKSGCQIEERQLGTADRIETCLAIDLVVAWRIFHLAKLGREVPDVPCTVFFEEFEWKALHTHITKTPIPPAEPPTLREALRMVATLGGFLGRKGDGEPGTTTLWRGLQYLDGIAAMWKYMVIQYAPHLLSSPVSREPPYG